MGIYNLTESREDQLMEGNCKYRADFIRLMDNWPQLTRKSRERIEHLMATCLALAEEDPVDLLKESITEELTTTEPVISCRGPFQIPTELFTKILSYIPLNTLLTCRLVNHYWNENSVPWIQAKNKESVLIDSDDFHGFCTAFEDAEILPVTKLEFSLEDLTSDQISKFLTQHGSSILHLGIMVSVSGRNRNDELFMKKLQLILRHVPNLRGLELEVEEEDWEIFPELSSFEEKVDVTLPLVQSLKLDCWCSFSKHFWEGFFAMIPNVGIIELAIHDFNAQDWEEFVDAMPKLSIHTLHHQTDLIKSPNFWIAMKEERSLKLKNLSLLINRESMRYLNPVKVRETLEAECEFLRSQAEILEVLSLITFQRLDDHQFHFQLPVFKNLRSAKFHYYRDSTVTIAPLEPEQLPKLKYLELTPGALPSGLFANSLFPSVQEISFRRSQTRSFRDPAVLLSVPQIVAKFPNLRKVSNLRISADVEDMEIIFVHLRSIEDLELEIVDNSSGTLENVNLALSGIPGQAGDGTKYVLSQLADRVGHESLPLWIHPSRPSLPDLKHLRRLVLGFRSEKDSADRVRIDGIGVYMTFLRMSPDLRLTLQGDFLISDELAGKLTAHFRNICFVSTPTTSVAVEL